MKPILEKVQSTPALSFTCYRRCEKHYPFMWHRHPEFELVVILSGQGQRFVGDHSDNFGPGHFVLTGPNLPHTWHTDKGQTLCEAVVVQFAVDCFGESFFDLPEMAEVRRLLDDSMRGVLFERAASCELQWQVNQLCEASPPQRLLGLMDVLCQLAEISGQSFLSSRAFSDRPCSERESRLNVALNYVHEHHAEAIRQEYVAEMMNMSASTFCRFFKRCTGKTFVMYLTEFRLGCASRLLMETDRTIAEICFECGFGNLSHFNRQFRAIKGVTPSAFRQQRAEKTRW